MVFLTTFCYTYKLVISYYVGFQLIVLVYMYINIITEKNSLSIYARSIVKSSDKLVRIYDKYRNITEKFLYFSQIPGKFSTGHFPNVQVKIKEIKYILFIYNFFIITDFLFLGPIILWNSRAYLPRSKNINYPWCEMANYFLKTCSFLCLSWIFTVSSVNQLDL